MIVDDWVRACQNSVNTNMQLNTITITSGALKDEVIQKVKEYNEIKELKGKFEKMIIYCSNT